MEALHSTVSPSIYRRLFLELDEAVAIVDDDAVYVDANPAATALLGVTLGDMLVARRSRDFSPPGR
ncbi:MAG: PAS domain-containing protein [Dehalococcoidia bacterium]|nr:PAS domain-containing protein [Dehalococcoidia bacterium]